MFIRALILYLITLSLGCAGSSDSASSSSTLTDSESSTIYKLSNTSSFFGNTGTSLSRIAYFNAGIEFLTIYDNGTYKFTRHGSSCTSVETGSLSFNNSTYTYTLTNRQITNSPTGNCTMNYVLTSGHTAYFTPSSWSLTLSEGPLADYSGAYFKSGNEVGLENSETTDNYNGVPHVYYIFRLQ